MSWVDGVQRQFILFGLVLAVNSKPKYKMLDAYQPQLIGSQGWESYDSMPGSFEGLATIYKLSQSLYELYEDRRWL
jgi:hypothetical protein